MSLDMTIQIQASATPDQLQAVLEQATPFRSSPSGYDEIKKMHADQTSLSIAYIPLGAAASTSRRGAPSIMITPTDRQSRAFVTNAVLACVALLRAYPGDVLLQSLDMPVLERKNGRIVLNRNAGIWDEGVEPVILPLITVPFEWGVLQP